MEKNKPAINVIGEEQCTGCFGCHNSCPLDAIDMKHDEEGFFIPFIKDNCESCEICQEHCPVIQDLSVENKFEEPKFFGGRSTDKETRMMSSSGGIFSEIARYVLGDSGVVFGAGWDDDLKLTHTKIKDIDEIEKLTGSKYIQSDIGNAYKEVKKELEDDKKVLFVGTPCQIAALNTHIDHDNLLTIDLVCHGVPSNILFEKYLDYKEKNYDDEIEQIYFRDKKKGWKDYQIKIIFKDGSVYGKNHKLDPYFRVYLSDLCLRSSCFECEFNCIPRPGNLSLGDFWGDTPEEISSNEGVSVILANSKKGERILKNLQERNQIEIIETDYKTATKTNIRVDGGEFQVPENRKDFIEDLKNEDFKNLKNKYIEIPNPAKFRLRKFVKRILTYLKK